MLRLAKVELDSAQRGEGGELVLNGLRYEDETINLSLAEFRSPMPLSLIWNGLHRRPAKAGEILLKGLDIRSLGSVENLEAKSPVPGPEQIFGEVGRLLDLAERWLPPVRLKDLSYFPLDEEVPFVLPAGSFESRELELKTEARGEIPGLRLTATFPVNGPWRLQAAIDAWKLGLQGDLDPKVAGFPLRGDFDRESGSGSYFLEWSEPSWTPSEAGLEMAEFQIPDGVGGLPTEFGPVEVDSLKLAWDGSDYIVDARIRGGQAVEELTLALSLAGDLETFDLQAFEVTGSWIRLTLGEPVLLDLETLEPEAPFQFSAYANLDGQEYYPAQGALNGTLEADVGPDGNYPLRFTLSGQDLQADGRALRSVELEGSFDFPGLVVNSLRVVLPEGSVADVEGSANFEERTLSIRGEADLKATDLDTLAGQPTGLEGGLQIEGNAEGPWERLIHRGTAKIEKFTPPGVVPLSLELRWEGEGGDRLTTDLSADTGEESVRFRSEWNREGSALAVRWADLEWKKSDQVFLALQEPVEVRLNLDELGRLPWEGLSVERIVLIGNGRELGTEWNPPQTASFRAVGIRASDFSGWLPPEISLPDVLLETVSLSVEDFEPILTADASVAASWWPAAETPPISVRVSGRLDGSGVDLTEIYAAYDETSLLNGNLILPVTLHPWILRPAGKQAISAGGEEAAEESDESAVAVEEKSFWKIISGGDLSGSLIGAWGPELREQIHEWGGPYLEEADLELKLAGTVHQPEARLSLDVHSMTLKEEWVGANFPMIRILELEVLVDQEKVLLKEGVLELRDSGIRLTGELPYPEVLAEYGDGKELDLVKVLGLLRADAELRNWDAEIWRDRLPILFRPQGKITGNIGIDPGLVLKGEVDVSGFSLRPTLYSPPVDDIHATLLLENRRVRLENAGASVGGGNLSASGVADLENWTDPLYEFTIVAKNVPAVRTPDMILRTDADLTLVQKAGDSAPLIKGGLQLRNSTFLISFDPFSPNIESGPGTRPPYFSVDEEPFSDWRIDLAIEGQDFLRVRSSIFSTELSASLMLTRTLGNPLLLGSVRADGGRIRFPGISMRIEAAEAFITPENPNLLQIEVDAIGQNRFYVVTMNVSGSAEDPQVQFSSTPTLSNAQIIRLLATGSLEGGGAGAIGLYLGQALLGPGTGEETLADRLSVEIGQEVTENGRSTVEVIYRLNDRWSVEGEYDRYDTYNLNLVRILLER